MRLPALLLTAAILAACPAPQSGACKKYVACESAYDQAAGHEAKDTTDYASDGACWKDQQMAAQCTQECNQNNAALKAAANDAALHVPDCE